MIRHSFAEREAGSCLPTETAQTRSRSWQLNFEKAKCPIPPPPRRTAHQCRPAPTPPSRRRASPQQGTAASRGWARVRRGKNEHPGLFRGWKCGFAGKMRLQFVLGRLAVAIFSLHVSLKGPRTGKAPLPGNISPPCVQNELALAIFARHASEKPRKSPFGNA